MAIKSENSKISLCSEMSVYSREEKELLIFPEVPRWIVVSKGAANLLNRINNMKITDIISMISDEELLFIDSLLDAQILVTDENETIRIEEEPYKEIYPLQGVWLNISSRCNLQCRHCFLGDKEENIELLTLKEIDKLIDEIASLRGENPVTLDITGGEPLLRKDIIEILKLANREGISENLITNGLLLTDDISNYLAANHVDTTISLDGPNVETHEFLRGINTFDRTVNNIKKAIKKGVPVTISITVHNGNQKELYDYFQFAKNLGVKRVILSFLNDFGYAAKNKIILPDEFETVHNILLKSIEDVNISNLIQNTALSKYIETVLLPVKTDCCGSGINTCSIGANGDVFPCPSFQINKFKAGNIRERSFSEIWNDYNTFIEHRSVNIGDLNPVCSKCDVRYFCGGGCRAQAYFSKENNLRARSSKCKEYKQTYLEIMWMLAEYPQLSSLRTDEGAKFIL